jgi:glycosyltransferase involved in cell wall biosynthesis
MPSPRPIDIIITGSYGPCLPPPYGGIIKRALLHAYDWKRRGARVRMQIHHWHDREHDLGAGAEYFYDYRGAPTTGDNIAFALSAFFRSPLLFLRLLLLLLRVWPEKSPNMISTVGKGVHLNAEIVRRRPDVIVTQTGGPHSICAVYLGQRWRIPVVFENYAEIQFRADSRGENVAERFAPAWRYLVNHSTLVIPASEHCAQGPREYSEDPTKIHIVYSGVNFEIFSRPAAKPKPELRRSFDLPQNKFLIMAVGALHMRKGHDQLFETVLRLPPERLRQIGIVLCGMGPADEMRRTAEEIGFPRESLNIFQGLTEERLAELYASVDCFCFPSITPRECMGMALKEGMCASLPIAAYDSGGIKEAIDHGVNGYLAPTGDRDALAGMLEDIITMSPEERLAMGRRSTAKAQALFDIRMTAGALYKLLERCVAHEYSTRLP